jgi:acetyltransferase-like isoleucine patch superfamily enzyme
VDYRPLFKSCGQNVSIAPDAYFDHPESIDVGDNVSFMRGFFMGLGKPGTVRIGNDVTFYPNCFIQGAADRFVIDHHVEFFPNTYISLGGLGSFIEIGHHTHFAPGCVLYGWGGLTISPYCNIAAHCVLATIGHDPIAKGKPMTLAPAKMGPITLMEDVWLCANVTVTANTTIAKGCVIGANAVVTRDTQPNGIYFGVPARWIRDR